MGGVIASDFAGQTQAPGCSVGRGISLALLVFCGVYVYRVCGGVLRGKGKKERGKCHHWLGMPEKTLVMTMPDFDLGCKTVHWLSRFFKGSNILSAAIYLF